MKYAVVKVVNGNFAISTEHGENKDAAVVAFHSLCASLWNDSAEVEAVVKIMDSNLDVVDGYIDFISHPAK